MTDPRIAALAEALATADNETRARSGLKPTTPATWEKFAAAILAALPPDWCGHDNRDREDEAWFMQKEISRLRRIEEAARVLIFPEYAGDNPAHFSEAWDALRDALEEKP